ncbi:MAG: dienelactone hydrolase family protein [Bryobacterales bacterium]|nr:dienelactone hydrolase family protein [Bryobacterales bacterium]
MVRRLQLPRLRWFVVAGLLLAGHEMAYGQVPETGEAPEWVSLYKPISDSEMPYRLMRPIGFDPARRYPVIVSLHGGGGRGTDNRRQLRVWNRLLAEEARRATHPSYVLAPQSTRLWDEWHLERIKRIVAALPSADMDRVYLLGHSMGGHGSFILLQIDPAYFAAAAPSAGTGRGQDAEFIDPALIKDIPIWAFHGEKDTVAPYERAQELFAEMQALDGNMKLTTFAGDGHGTAAKMITGSDNGSTSCASDRCDPEPDMLKWLFGRSLADSR